MAPQFALKAGHPSIYAIGAHATARVSRSRASSSATPAAAGFPAQPPLQGHVAPRKSNKQEQGQPSERVLRFMAVTFRVQIRPRRSERVKNLRQHAAR